MIALFTQNSENPSFFDILKENTMISRKIVIISLTIQTLHAMSVYKSRLKESY